MGGVLAAQALVLRLAPAVQQVAADEGARHVGHILPRPAGDDVEEGVDGVRADLLLKGRQLNADDVADEGELAEVLVAAHGGRFLAVVVIRFEFEESLRRGHKSRKFLLLACLSSWQKGNGEKDTSTVVVIVYVYCSRCTGEKK